MRAVRSRTTSMLTRAEELALARAWLEKGDLQARNKIILAFEPQAAAQAAKWAKKSNLSYQDLFQEANLALITALDKFNPDNGNGFSAFVRNHILERMDEFNRKYSGPTHGASNVNDKKVWHGFRKAVVEFEKLHGRRPTSDDYSEIATMLGVPVENVHRTVPRLRHADVSLDAPVIDPAGKDMRPATVSRLDIMVDADPSPEEQTIEKIDNQKVGSLLSEILAELDDREREIVIEKVMNSSVKFSELASRWEISRERVRQVESRALDKLRGMLNRRGIHMEDLIAA